MELSSIFHQPKSNYAYSISTNDLVVWLRCKKNDTSKVKIIYCDPFEWYETGPHIKELIMEKKYETELFDYYLAQIHTLTKRIKYAFRVFSKENVEYEYGASSIFKVTKDYKLLDLVNYFNFPFLNEEDLFISPQWSKETIWYQIFMDRFHNVDNDNCIKWNSIEKVTNHHIFGGNIKGCIAKLDYLADLGVSGIYFTPIFEAKSVHKYDTIDYKKIDPQFGTNEDFKELVEKAHEKGIKIMLDIVFNHCGYYHPFFQDVLQNGQSSKYADCFCYVNETNKELFIKGKPNYHQFAFCKDMPKWNTNNPIVREHLFDATRFWIEKYDVDGYRLDVSNEVSHDFWKEFNHICKSIKSDFFIIGENWDNSNPWLAKDQFDAVMNYELYFPIIQYFCQDKVQASINNETFAYHINNVITGYPYNSLSAMFNLVSSHDTPRIKNKCLENEALVKLCYLFLFVFTGSPNIYYGDELGISGGKDPDNRRCMDFSKVGNDMYNFMKKLIQIKKTYLYELNSIHINWLDYRNDNNAISFNKENIYCLINNSQDEINMDTTSYQGKYINLFTDEAISLKDKISIKPYGFYLLKKI